jgi:transcriptional regulator with XRE-family HTH domain
MELHEFIAKIRKNKNFSQEEMAEQLMMSVSGYSKIERGESELFCPRLKQIADVLGLELKLEPKDLFNNKEKAIFNLASSHYESHQNTYFQSPSKDLEHTIEKQQIIVEQKDKELNFKNEEIVLLKQQVEDLRSMLDFLKK